MRRTKLLITCLFLTLMLLVGQTTTTSDWDQVFDLYKWTGGIPLWELLFKIVFITLPFLTMIIIVRSIFKHFTREW